MSLINKMLQDLDARGTAGGDPMQPHIKAVAPGERSVPLRVVVGALAGALVIAVLGAAGWRYLHKAAPAAQPVMVVMTPVRPAAAPAIAVSAAPAATVVTVAPAAAAVTAASAPATAVTAAPPVAQAIPPTVPAAAEAPAPAVTDDEAAPVAKPARMTRKGKRAEKARRGAEQKEEARARKSEERKAHAAGSGRAQHDADAAPAGKGKHETAVEGREETAGQRAEGAYRRGLVNLQEGRVTEALAALRQALQIDAHHDAARQTLVGLLIEHGQADEAMHQLQLGLTLDARQPSLAMLLARLQIERGGSGIETLMRTLPYAGANGEYHAFLAGALQRQQRHREAAEQYQAALRGAPQNGVWWMGLGISLQAEKRDAEALDAFQKAKASGALSPELLAFVDGKLRQLR